MNTDFPDDDLGPLEPGIDQLISILTSGPAPDELAGEQNALAMFRSSRPAAATQRVTSPQDTKQQKPAPRSWRYRRPAWVSGIAALGLAAALVVAAYTAALPAPVQ